MSEKFELFKTFSKIGAFTFGGGYAMIPLIESQCVENKKWFTHDEFMNMTVIAESTPGPIAINCATYVGYKREGVLGAVCATFGVVLPSFIIILLVSLFFESVLKYEIVRRGFAGIRIAVSILILQAGITMVSKLLKNKSKRPVKIFLISLFFTIMLLINIFELNISFIYLMLVGAGVGVLLFNEKVNESKKSK